MRTLAKITVLAFVALIAGIGLIYSGLYDVSASRPHGRIAAWIMSTSSKSAIARRARNVDVPELEDKAFILVGASDYESMCVDCHGAPGRPITSLAKGLNPPAPNLAETAANRSPAELFWATKHGIRMTGMPAWGATHDDSQLWGVVAFVKTMPDLDAQSYEAMREQAKGLGHHSVPESPPKSEGVVEVSPDEGLTESPEETKHDHSTHKH